MRQVCVVVSLAVFAAMLAPLAFAQKPSPELNNPLPRHFPTKARVVHEFARSGGGQNLVYWGGPVIPKAKVVAIFWGPTWLSGGSDSWLATSLNNFIARFGTTGEYNVITQYYETNPTMYILSGSLYGGQPYYDNSTPPPNVTDADIQAEVLRQVGTPASDTIYEVFLPKSSYSSDGNYTSCGGPNLYYCAYHGNFNHNGTDVKYASMPYPSCGGCSSFSSVAQDFEHFISHETREAVTDPDGNAWFDRRGYEADDKCAWSPAPFADSSTGTNQDGTGFAYQYEWSNASGGCVKTR
jgi:hypothetical protein